jgi:hypothetical protein
MTEEQQRVFDKDMSQKETDLVIDRNLLEKWLYMANKTELKPWDECWVWDNDCSQHEECIFICKIWDKYICTDSINDYERMVEGSKFYSNIKWRDNAEPIQQEKEKKEVKEIEKIWTHSNKHTQADKINELIDQVNLLSSKVK